jgi:6-phosphofructokinase 1
MEQAKDFTIQRLGDCTIPSPMSGIRFTGDEEHILLHSDLGRIRSYLDAGSEPPKFEAAGPRERIFFDPSKLTCGIVTCGGLCPGLNDVIRAIVLSLHHHYGVRTIYGFPYGYEGLAPKFGHQPIMLTPQVVAQINEMGGTMLGSSRGNQEVPAMVDTLERMKVGLLFCIGGDGTQWALAISEEARRRGLKLSVIGIPKAIDNDISYVQTTFGFETAVSEAKRATSAANAEASGARNGIGLVKLMGRDSGFIAAFSVLVDNEVNFCLIPEVPFTLEGFLSALKQRLERRGHAVIVLWKAQVESLRQR